MSAQSPTVPESPLVGVDQIAPLFRVVRHFVSFLKWRFSKLPPGGYRWDPETDNTPEQKNSEIHISADTPMNPELVGRRPAITVARASAAFSGLGIGDLAFRELHTGASVRMDLLPTTIMINCLSQEPVEAETIAAFCVSQISAFREAIVKESRGLLLYTGSKPMLSAPSPAGSLVDTSADDWRVVVVSYPTYLQDCVTHLPLNRPILNSITTTLNVKREAAPPEPVVPLQGTAVMQPPQSPEERDAAVSRLPQRAQTEAQSSEPLQVKIQTP